MQSIARAASRLLGGNEERHPGVDYGRRVVVLCALAAALSYCDRTNMSVAIVAMSHELKWTDIQKSHVLGAFFWGYLFSQFAGASLSQKYGGRIVLGVAAVLWSLLTWFMPALARTHIDYLSFGRFLLGLAEGVTFPAIYYLLRQYVPHDERSRSVAAISVGTMFGAIVSFLLSPLLVRRFGWDSVFLFFGGVAGPLLIFLWFHFVPSFRPDDVVTDRDDPTSVKADLEDGRGTVPAPLGYLQMLKQPVLLAVFCAHFAHNLCHFALMSWLPLFLHEKFEFRGDSLAFSALPWFVMMVSVLFSSSYADYQIARTSDVSDVRRRFTVKAFSIAGVSMLLVGFFCSYQYASPALTLIFLCLALAANGASTSGGYEAAKLDLSRSAASASRLQSLSNTLATLAGVVGIPLVPHLKGEHNKWENVFFGLGFTFFAAAAMFHIYGRWTKPIM